MFQAEFSIEHAGCWGSDVSLVFPQSAFSSVDCRWVGGKVAHIVRVDGPAESFDAVLAYFRKRKDVPRVDELSRDGAHLFLRVLTRKTPTLSHFSDVFFENHCFTAAPTRFQGAREVWSLAASAKENLAAVHVYLKKRFSVTVRYLRESGFSEDLTSKQREVFSAARHMGYYAWPRRITATALAKGLGVSKTVLLSHLRKAEIRILSAYQ
ncbi:MAG: helix-turn-helix domain-containing protein [Candidatus Micrarchaeota archaeon]|nr:helix-turn-helix domain-containing protein [Candidatus Micrarchaeota archaeon]